MNRADSTLATIRCEASQAAIDALLFGCGLRARAAGDPHHFDILNAGRDSEPEVSQDLWELALTKLRKAAQDGALPPFSITRGALN